MKKSIILLFLMSPSLLLAITLLHEENQEIALIQMKKAEDLFPQYPVLPTEPPHPQTTSVPTKPSRSQVPPSPGEYVMDPENTVRIDGAIDKRAITVADLIHEMTSKGQPRQIDMFINSSGGSIIAGGVVVAAMTQAQARGYTFKCAVGTMAMSMGFVILSYCDERVALFNSRLLWHPGRVYLGRQQTVEQLEAMTRSLRILEELYEPKMLSVLGISKEEYDLACRQELPWSAEALVKVAPHFLSIVRAIRIDNQLKAYRPTNPDTGSDDK